MQATALSWPTPTRFRILLAAVLAAAFVALQALAPAAAPNHDTIAWQHDKRLHVFFHPECPHCYDAIAFLKTQKQLSYVLHDVSSLAGKRLLLMVARQFGIPETALGVPFIVRGSRFLVGFESGETTGKAILALATDESVIRKPPAVDSRIRLPLLGEIDPTAYSLLGLAAIMGLADGFNPCAMWVLIYLISLIAGLHDRRRIWWLVGTFVLVSGVLYFLFMTAWLHTFLLVGYIRPLTQLVALAAIGFGLDHLYEIAIKRGVIVCEVGSVEQRQRTMGRIRDIVAAPVGIGSLLLVTGLAFTVNSIEFVCSAALPAIFTHTLALTALSAAQYYGYIAAYVVFFMLDDLIIFGLAAFAIQRVVDTRYASVSRAVGGIVLIALGGWMLFR